MDDEKDKKKQPRLAVDSRKPPDPFWVWAEQTARGRDDGSPGKETYSDEAAARLDLLRQSAANFAAKLPSSDEWWEFLSAEVIPVFNSISTNDRMCLECGKRFAVPERAVPERFCSEACGARRASKERLQRAEVEKLQRLQERLEVKMKGCRSCAPNAPCARHLPELTKYKSALEKLGADAITLQTYATGDGDTTKIDISGLAALAKPDRK